MVTAIGRSNGTSSWLNAAIQDENRNYIYTIESRGNTDTLLTLNTLILKKGWKMVLDAHDMKTKELFRFIYASGQPVVIKY